MPLAPASASIRAHEPFLGSQHILVLRDDSDPSVPVSLHRMPDRFLRRLPGYPRSTLSQPRPLNLPDQSARLGFTRLSETFLQGGFACSSTGMLMRPSTRLRVRNSTASRSSFFIGSAVADNRRITMTSQDILHTGDDLGTESTCSAPE